VIGHEFSHILNGDMRLSIRLAAMLRGITFIGDVGSILLRSSSRRRRYSSSNKDDGRGAALAVGLGLYLIGLLGGLMAGLIKSAISKQKEYLADASAVQFTRNPEGIGDALKIIGGHASGTFVDSTRAEEMSHLFFGQVKHRLWSGFATHPPIKERIARIDPDWDGQFLPAPAPEKVAAEATPNADADPGHRAALAAIAATAAVACGTYAVSASPSNMLAAQDEDSALLEETRDPLGAMAVVLAMAWDPLHERAQWQALEPNSIAGLAQTTRRWCEPVRRRTGAQRLSLLELCLPTLRGLSAEQYRVFRERLLSWISADGKTVLGEWCLFQIVRHYLDPVLQDTRPTRPKHKTLAAVSCDLATALGALAHLTVEDTERAFTRGAEMLDLPLVLPDVADLEMSAFGAAIDNLAACYPLLKVPILKAMAAVAADDGVISDNELTLVKAIAAVMDCPMPDAMLTAHGIAVTAAD